MQISDKMNGNMESRKIDNGSVQRRERQTIINILNERRNIQLTGCVMS